MRIWIIIDEAQHVLLSDAKQNSAKGSASLVEQMIAMSRGHGISIYGVAQRCGAILDELKSDAFFRMSFSLGSGDEIWEAKRALSRAR